MCTTRIIPDRGREQALGFTVPIPYGTCRQFGPGRATSSWTDKTGFVPDRCEATRQDGRGDLDAAWRNPLILSRLSYSGFSKTGRQVYTSFHKTLRIGKFIRYLAGPDGTASYCVTRQDCTSRLYTLSQSELFRGDYTRTISAICRTKSLRADCS